MKKFKQFFTETQSKHDALFLILAGDIKIDRTNACKIWDKCGKRDNFRHITSLSGLSFLLKNKNPKVAISAMKFGKRMKGIETEGDVLVVVEGDYEVWFPDDAFSYIDRTSKRWISIDNYDMHFNIFGDEFFFEYLGGLKKLLDKYRIPKTLEDEYEAHYDIQGGKILLRSSVNLEKKVKQMETDYKKEMTKFKKEALAFQVSMLDRYSAKISKHLVREWNDSKVDKERREDYKGRGFDEAIISNVEVKEIVYTKDSHYFSRFLERIDEHLEAGREDFITNLEYNIPPYMLEMLNSDIKIPFTYLGKSYKFGKMLKAMKDFPLAMKFMKDHYGLIQKGHFLVRK